MVVVLLITFSTFFCQAPVVTLCSTAGTPGFGVSVSELGDTPFDFSLGVIAFISDRTADLLTNLLGKD